MSQKTETNEALELLGAGQLESALAAATTDVRTRPADGGSRCVLAELLCVAGDLERADKQLDILSTQQPHTAVDTVMLRQVIRGEQARRQFYSEGRLPELRAPVSDCVQLHLRASIALREHNDAEAIDLLEQADAQRPRVRGRCNGQPVDDLRDLDDMAAPVLEVLTTGGKFFWVPLAQLGTLDLRAPTRVRDMAFRSARMLLQDGTEADVFIPALYPSSYEHADARVRLGRMTLWAGNPVRGAGQRMFLAGDAAMALCDIRQIEVDPVEG